MGVSRRTAPTRPSSPRQHEALRVITGQTFEPSASMIPCPHGLACNGTSLYTVDFDRNRVDKHQLADHTLAGSVGAHSFNNSFRGPTDICVIGDSVYVADSGNSRVVVLSTDLTWRYSFGHRGRHTSGHHGRDGEMYAPWGLASTSDELFISNKDNSRIQVVALGATGLQFDRAGPGMQLVPGGRSVRKTQTSNVAKRRPGQHFARLPGALGLTAALHGGRASATFRLDCEPAEHMCMGVFPADLKLFADDIKSAEGKRCAVILSGWDANALVVADGETTAHNRAASMKWQRGDRIEVEVAYESDTEARVSIHCKGIACGRLLRDVPPCGLRFGVGLHGAGHGVTLVASSIEGGAGVHEPRRSFGGRGEAPGLFNSPTGVAIVRELLVVADSGNRRVQVLTQAGVPLQTLPLPLYRGLSSPGDHPPEGWIPPEISAGEAGEWCRWTFAVKPSCDVCRL